jgi:hypothetical protein
LRTKVVEARPYVAASHYAELAKWRAAYNRGERSTFVTRMMQEQERSLVAHGFDPDSPPAGMTIAGLAGASCPHCHKEISALMPAKAEIVTETITRYIGGDAVKLEAQAGHDADQAKFAALNAGEPLPETPLASPETDTNPVVSHEALIGLAQAPGKVPPNSSTHDQLRPSDPLLAEIWDRKPVPKQGPAIDLDSPEDEVRPKSRGKKG